MNELLTPLRPRHFREPAELSSARISPTGPQFAAKKVKLTGSRALGVKYEQRVHAELIRLYPRFYVNNPWFRFYDNYGLRWCQPDGLLIDAGQGLVTIVEVKYRHVGAAWWKLQKLYLPVARSIFGDNWTYRCVEIVRWYEPDELFPNSKLTPQVHLAPALPSTGVHIWNP